jgi:hypothetical protein
MKKYITTLILVMLFVGLLGYFYFYESGKEDTVEEEELAESTFTAFEIDTSAINEIDFEYGKNKIAVKKNDDGSWKIIKPKKAKADTDEIERLLQSLGAIEAKGEEIQYDSLSDFGLEEPAVKVVMKTEEGSKEVIFGDLSIGGTEVYVKTSEGEYVFLTDKLLLDTMKVKEEELKEKENQKNNESKQ